MKSNPIHPLISVIIPSYNRGWCLKEAVDSVLSQSYDNYEVIIIDDGSTDNTPKQIANYTGITIITQHNRGVSAARNRGVRQSKGDLIAFLDSDDIWLPGKLSAQVIFFQNRPEAEICQTQEIWIKNGKRMNPGSRHTKASGFFFERSLGLCLVSPSAVMMRRRLLETVGYFDENLPACEDYDLWLRINATIPIYLIEEAHIIKRGGHKDQLSAAWGLDKYRIQSMQNLLASGNLDLHQQRAVISTLKNKCRIYANGCQKRGKDEEMRYYQELAASVEA